MPRLGTDMPERELCPPEPSPAEIRAADELEWRQQEAYETAMCDTLHGRGDFYDLDRWDSEQWVPVFAAVQTAIALTDAELGRAVRTAVALEAARYAAHMAEEA